MKQIVQPCQDDKIYNPNTSDFWDKKINYFSDKIINSPIYIDKNKIVVKSIKKSTGNVLDVGFGYGNIERLILQNNIKLKLHGIDISKYAVKIAKTSFKGIFKIANIYDIPFKDNFFDVVLALDVLEHLPKDKILLALKEINRITKRGAKFVITLPINENSVDKTKNGHLRSYNLKIIKSELQKTGFIIKEYKFLYAFNKFYHFKNLINKILNIKKPNLIFVSAIKK